MYRFETDSENCTKEELATTERTKIWIAETAKKLLEKKTIEALSVAEICRAAGIGRQTFYYHFADKNELMAWMFLQNTVDVNLLNVESVARGFEALRENYVFFRRVYEDTSQDPMWRFMLKYYIEYYTKLLKKKLGVDTLDAELEYYVRHYSHGTLGTAQEWLLNNDTTPARVEAQMMHNSMPGPMRKVFFADEAEV